MPAEGPRLNEHQARRLRIACEHIDQLLSRIEHILGENESGPAFPQYIHDITPEQQKTIEDFIARIRARLVRVLDGQGVPRKQGMTKASLAISTTLISMDISAEEMKPRYMRGYGEVSESAVAELNGISGELQALLMQFHLFMKQEAGQDPRARMKRLEEAGSDLSLLGRIERVVADRGLVEFRSAINAILDRAEDISFEIAVFGRVSSGKSSLLNAILGTDVLPVGVTPVTAVPVRITRGDAPSITVSFAGSMAKELGVSELGTYATEQENPGNRRNVTRITVRLPSARLSEGISFVDTPGLGSLATHGASETLAYLPKCDLGVVLIDAGSTLTEGDLRTILALQGGGIPVNILLSKADLLSSDEIRKITGYIRQQVSVECQIDLPVYPVSSRPSHIQLSNTWFDEQIQPLYSRLRELRAQSLSRKIGILRESVTESLQFRIRADSRTRHLSGETAQVLEERLRKARGAIEEARSEGNRLIAAMGKERPAIVSGAAVTAVPLLSNTSEDPVDPGGVLRVVVASAVHERVGELKDLLDGMAKVMQKELDGCADMTGSPDRPAPDELRDFFRGMPVFDPGILEFEDSRPAMAAILGEQYAYNQRVIRIREAMERQIDQPYRSYIRLLEDWVTRETRQFAERFEMYAGRYRALAERLFSGDELTDEEIQAIEEDLKELDSTPPIQNPDALKLDAAEEDDIKGKGFVK